MTKRTAAILVLILCLLAAIPAMAADVFKFTDQAITVYADETVQPSIEQDGRFAEGTLVYKSANVKVFTVDETAGCSEPAGRTAAERKNRPPRYRPGERSPAGNQNYDQHHQSAGV